MNCRPGDLARIVHPGEYGRLVLVLHAAPYELFNLPDGYPSHAGWYGDWVLETLGSTVQAETGRGQRAARYFVCNDKWLRPIRDGEGDDETFTWAGKPVKETA